MIRSSQWFSFWGLRFGFLGLWFEWLNKRWSGYSEGSSSLLLNLSVSKLCSVSNVSISSRLTSDSHDSGMDSAWDAILTLLIQFWEIEMSLAICWSILDILSRGFINKLSHYESTNAFVLGDNSAAVPASCGVRVSLVFLSSPVVSPFRWHLYSDLKIR